MMMTHHLTTCDNDDYDHQTTPVSTYHHCLTATNIDHAHAHHPNTTTNASTTTGGANVVMVMSPVVYFKSNFCIFYSEIMIYSSIDNQIWIVWYTGKLLFCNTESLVVW